MLLIKVQLLNVPDLAAASAASVKYQYASPPVVVPPASGGYGLRAMAERAESVGGSLVAANAPDGGVMVRLAVPLALGMGAEGRAQGEAAPAEAEPRVPAAVD